MTNKEQCKAKTKSSNRCKNKGDHCMGYCYTHYQLWCVDKVEDYPKGKINV